MLRKNGGGSPRGSNKGSYGNQLQQPSTVFALPAPPLPPHPIRSVARLQRLRRAASGLNMFLTPIKYVRTKTIF